MELKLPIIIVNFKTNKEATGQNALKLARICDEVAKETGKSIAVAVQPTDIKEISSSVSIPVLAQHVDGISYGSHTGHILPEAIKDAGAIGSLINHSEDQVGMDEIESATKRLKEVEMARIICADTPQKVKDVIKYSPDFIAIEPPEYIGSTGLSVSTARPEVITESVSIAKQENPNVKLLCGAGVNNSEDIMIALKLGAVGFLLATAVVKAEDPKKVLTTLASNL